MSVTPSSTVVGTFTDRGLADQAVEGLFNAGFAHEQIRYSAPNSSGSFFEDIKSFFTGTSTDRGDVANNLSSMGLPDEDVRYYSNEYNNGNTILAVQAPGREEEALSILRQYGTSNARVSSGSSKEPTNDVQQPSTYTRRGDYAPAGQQNVVQNWASQAPSQALDETQPNNVAAQSNMGYQPRATSAYEATPQNSQASAVAPGQNTASQSSQANPVALEQVTDYQTSPSNADDQGSQARRAAPVQEAGAQTAPSTTTDYNAAPQAASRGASENDAGYQASQAGTVSPMQGAQTQMAQPGAASSGSAASMDELQQLQQQLQSLQQQLQEAKAQLQAAKEQESQIMTTREREQKLQAARQQMQDIQAELQATQAELQATQARIGQYQ